MSVYLIADVQVTDDSWVPDYAANVHNLVEKHGGKYLSRSGNIKVLEGETPDSTPSRWQDLGTPFHRSSRKRLYVHQAPSLQFLSVVGFPMLCSWIPYLSAHGATQ